MKVIRATYFPFIRVFFCFELSIHKCSKLVIYYYACFVYTTYIYSTLYRLTHKIYFVLFFLSYIYVFLFFNIAIRRWSKKRHIVEMLINVGINLVVMKWKTIYFNKCSSKCSQFCFVSRMFVCSFQIINCFPFPIF